jgi:phytoene synthase
MQYINFIRDINEDLKLGRVYMPMSAMKEYELISLQHDYVIENKLSFNAFIRNEIDRFKKWQKKAENGFRYIPSAYLVSIKTASDMYQWTADEIRRDPFIIYRRKVIPKVEFIRQRLALNRRLLSIND